jgi:hypothetical protein
VQKIGITSLQETQSLVGRPPPKLSRRVFISTGSIQFIKCHKGDDTKNGLESAFASGQHCVVPEICPYMDGLVSAVLGQKNSASGE